MSPLFQKRSGFALLLVLGFIVLLSFLTFGILKNMQKEMIWQAEGYLRPALQNTARSSLEAVLGVINSFKVIDGNIYAPRQGWGDPFALMNWEYSSEEKAYTPDGKTYVNVSFIDESSKISLSSVDKTILSRAIELSGVSRSESERLADIFIDWTDSDDNTLTNGAEIGDYESEGLKGTPPNRKMMDFSEFKYMKDFSDLFFEEGQPNDRYRYFSNVFSLYASAGKPNVNTISKEALEVLSYETGSDSQTILSYQNVDFDEFGRPLPSAYLIRNATDLAQADATNISSQISFGVRSLRIIIKVKRGEAQYLLDTLVEISSTRGNNSPFRVVYQRENILL